MLWHKVAMLIGSLLDQLDNPFEFLFRKFHVDLVIMGVEKGEEFLWGGGVGYFSALCMLFVLVHELALDSINKVLTNGGVTSLQVAKFGQK